MSSDPEEVLDISALEPLSLREVWPDEAQDFTPWLADNLHMLTRELDLHLELEGVEVPLTGAGRVDILAQQVGSKARVVIENQLEVSDDSHCLRLLGYAANADANILVWVASGFTNYHCSLLAWLNESDSIAVYAVAVRAYRVGGNIAADFRLVVEPRPSGATPTSAQMTGNTYFAAFYRPLVEQLRRSGMLPVGRGGWRGRWRSFQTGYPQVVYAAGLSKEKAWAFLQVDGTDAQHIYHALTNHRAEIDAELNGDVEWSEGKDKSWFGMRTAAAISDPRQDFEPVRDWIVRNLLQLWTVVQPRLNQVIPFQIAEAG